MTNRAGPRPFVREALNRWAREAWLLNHDRRPQDALTAREIAAAAQVVLDRPWGSKSNGPLQALADALDRMGWSIGKGGSVFHTRLGQELELPVTSPREVIRVA